MTRFRLVAILLLAAASAHADQRQDLAAYADAAMKAAYPASDPGAAVLVRWKGETVLRKGYGMASVELGVPVSPDHVFEIGSVTKQFTGAAIMRLVEQGKVSLSDPITKYLPDFTTGDKTVTIEQLLTHTSGVPSYTDMPEWVPRWREDMSLDTLIAIFKGKPLDFAPGERWSYSNSGYILLGAVIEKASGKSYEDFVEQEIFAPLGMTHTRYGHQEELVPGRAEGYAKGEHGYQPAPYLSLTQPYAAGSLMSTVDDLALWIDALEAGKAVSPASRDRMLTPEILRGGALDGVSTRYGFGIGTGAIASHRAMEHGGGIHGFACDVLSVPDEKLQVVILSNNPDAEPGPGLLAQRIAAKALGKPLEDRKAIAVPEAKLDEYVGVYSIPDAAEQRRVISREGSTLRLQRTGAPLRVLQAIDADLFGIEGAPTTVRFERDAKGAVVALTVDQGMGPVSRSPRTNEPMPAERKAAAVDAPTLDALVGTYELMPGFDLTISRRGEQMFLRATGQDEAEMFAESPTRFFLKIVDAQVDFVREGGSGPATGLVLHQGGRDMPGTRKP